MLNIVTCSEVKRQIIMLSWNAYISKYQVLCIPSEETQNLYLSCSQRTGRGLVQLQWRTLSSFITQTVPVCVGKEKASHVGGIWLLAPKLTVHPYPLLCARNCLPRRPRVCSHQSHVLFVPHWPVGSSPPAAVEMSVSVPAKWGTQMCVCDGEQGQMLLGTSSSHALPASLSRGRKKKIIRNFAPIRREFLLPFGEQGYLHGLCGEPQTIPDYLHNKS